MKTILTSKHVFSAGCVLVLVHAYLFGLPMLRMDHSNWSRWTRLDDAFYYFQTAWNYTHGRGLTLDGMSPTNGFHPFWMLIVSGIAWLSPSKDIFLTAIRFVSLVLFYSSALFFSHLSKVVFKSRALSILAVILYLAIPQLFRAHMNGMETGLTLLITIIVLSILVSRGSETVPSYSMTFTFGVFTALLFLSRTDSIFTVLAVWTVWLLGSVDSRTAFLKSRTAMGSAIRHTVLLTIPFILFVVPWLLWCLVKFGHIVQSSGFVDPIIARRWYATHFDFGQTGMIHLLTGLIFQSFSYVLSFENLGISLPLFLCILGLSWVIVILVSPRDVRRRYGLASGILAFFFVALIVVHTLVRLTPSKGWYYYPSQLLLMLAILGIMYGVSHFRLAGFRVVGMIIVMLSVVLLYRPSFRLYAYLRKQPSAENRVKATMSERYGDTRGRILVLGATDCGDLAFFAPDNVSVVNLDGLINEAAARAIAKGRLGDYILSTPISRFQIRAPICLLESIMGHGFRGHFITQSISHVDWKARPRPPSMPDEQFLALPSDGRIHPARVEDWKYLVGEWRNLTGEHRTKQCRVAVKDVGIRFGIRSGGEYELHIVLASPFPRRNSTFDVFLDGKKTQAMKYRGRARAVRWEPVERGSVDSGIKVTKLDTLIAYLGSINEGMHEIIFHNHDSSSPFLAGIGENHLLYSSLINEFRVTLKE